MEQGLLSRLQSYFNASFGGRYVEYIIKEAVEEQPKLAKLLFGVKHSDTLEVEYRFQAASQTRIADLAFIDAETKRPTCLIEIKYDDHKSPTNATQIEDYKEFCRQQNCKFIFLSQHLPPEDQRKKLPSRKALVLFSELAEKLKSSDGSIGGLLRRFFVDRGLVMHKFESKDLANLKSLLFRLLNPRVGQGRSQNKEAMSGGSGDAFGNLLRNVNIVVRETLADSHSRAPTVDFHLEPFVNPKLVKKYARSEPKSPSIAIQEAKAGGELYVFGRVYLHYALTGWLYVEFGIGLEVKPREKDFYPFTFAEIGSDHFNDTNFQRKKAPLSVLYDKQKAATAVKQRISEAVGHMINRSPPRKHVTLLKKFRSAL